MRSKLGMCVAAGAFALSAGCRTTLEASMWLPDFASAQTSGAGGTELDLDNDLGVVPDESVLVYGLVGDAGRNRVRLDYWGIHGEGTSNLHDAFDFSSTPYDLDEPVTTVIDLTAIGILWEPALINADGFRLRLAVGLDLLQFSMSVDGATNGLSVADVPGPDGPLAGLGADYMPVPKVGVGFEAELKPWMRLQARAQMFDASYLNLDADFEGTFTNAVAGLVFGRYKGIRGFVGYRHFNAEYSYADDAGDSTLKGLVATASLRF